MATDLSLIELAILPHYFTGTWGGGTVGDYVPLYTPKGSTSQQVFTSISTSLCTWVDHA